MNTKIHLHNLSIFSILTTTIVDRGAEKKKG